MKQDIRIIIDCENMSERDIDELYYQLSLKTSCYGATMTKEVTSNSANKKVKK